MPPRKPKALPQPIAIDSLKHTADSRTNIPTEELRDFVKDEEHHPKTMRYPRNPDLDPQMVWRGKDEQDNVDLEVPVVPIYIQEKIHPQAIIEDICAIAKGSQPQADLFSDFNGIEFEQLIEFYQHQQNWQNRMILGDSLQVMTSFAEKERLKGKVQMIYLDPPYGIKFGSNWQVSTRKRDVKDGKAEDFTRQPEQIKAFRDTWELGIHSYLAYLRDRLVVARELLTESGSVFVQIGDESVHLVRCLLDEVFGADNFIAEIIVQKTGSQSSDFLPVINDFICCYAKTKELVKWRDLYQGREERNDNDFSPDPLTSSGTTDGSTFTFSFCGRDFHPGGSSHWKTNKTGMSRLEQSERIVAQKTMIRFKKYWQDFPVKPLSNIWTGIGGAPDMVYVVQTNTKVIERCLLMTTDPGDLVLDPTCGSGTTAYVAEQWGRRWITVDTSRVALALARTRLMAARYPFYLLADSTDGIKKQAELTAQSIPDFTPSNDIKQGFVYKTVPHVTLKSIANNAEIDVIHARWRETLEPLRSQLNAAVGQAWEEWEIPRDAGDWDQAIIEIHRQWWEARRKRQQEIDASIARNADTETLYDQPFEDKRRLRVTGPFTVESLSPHRMLPTHLDDDKPPAISSPDETDFTTMILDNLRKAGVQNTVKDERLIFDRLEPFAGQWLHAEGDYTEKDGTARRVAVFIGSEHGTGGALQIKEAAKEAIKGVGFDLLLICGFAFDPSVNEEAKQFGSLTVLPVKMNPDLAMGDELLKKTGSGNLFMVFGEPDISPIDPKTGNLIVQKDGTIQIEIKGVDIYDPTTGQIRSHGIADIACWFIDTNYNGESFFIRHAYFTGGDQPYEKLKKALKADVDESAWESLYCTKSRPFPIPVSGKVAVKVINHYGDEVLKVFGVQ
jgi:adenine-specific DNA-methyltransferase